MFFREKRVVVVVVGGGESDVMCHAPHVFID